jgi:hypothetical protein
MADFFDLQVLVTTPSASGAVELVGVLVGNRLGESENQPDEPA